MDLRFKAPSGRPGKQSGLPLHHPACSRNKVSFIVLAFIGALFFSCTPKVAETIRKHTYPPEFNFITSEQLKSTMWQFAEQVSKLETVMADQNIPSESRRQEVVLVLRKMEKISLALGGADWPSNHPKVSRNIARFREDLAAARSAVEREPPIYYLVGSISGACAHCHQAK